MTNIKQKDCPECKDLPEGEVVAGHDHREFTIKKPEEDKTNVISKTYVEMAEEWNESEKKNGSSGVGDIDVVQFAKWLDSMPYLFPHLELMAMRKAREIDREVYLAMVDALGIEKSTQIAREIHRKHKHQ